MNKLISTYQSVFVLRRWIPENEVIVHEILRSFKKKKFKKNKKNLYVSNLVIKVDMNKIYNRVEWQIFLFILK